MRPLVRPALLLGVVLLAGVLGTATVAYGANATNAVAAANASATAANADEPTAAGNIVDFDFEWPGKNDNTVPAGTTVTFTNRGVRPHTITDRGGTFDKLVMPGQSASVTLTIPGEVSFFCKIRAAAAGSPKGMDGLLVVEETTPAMVKRIQAVDSARAGSEMTYDPTELSVEAGSTIQLANVGGKPHSLTADDGSFDTGPVPPGAEGGRFAGQNATITVTQPGTYPFHCTSHPDQMRGVLEVRAKPVATAPGTTVPTQDQSTTALATDAQSGGGLFGDTWTLVALAGLVVAVIGLVSAATLRRSRRVKTVRPRR